MNPELKEYKLKTLNQLLTTLPHLEARLEQTTESAEERRLTRQLEAMERHIEQLRQELVEGQPPQPVADDLCRKAAQAIVKQKFYLGQKSVNELETIEPFYPGIERMKNEIESGKISRRTRSIAQGNTPPFLISTVTLPADDVAKPPMPEETISGDPALETLLYGETTEPPTGKGWSNLFQFHIVASCFVVILIFCMMAGVGTTTLLGYLIEGS